MTTFEDQDGRYYTKFYNYLITLIILFQVLKILISGVVFVGVSSASDTNYFYHYYSILCAMIIAMCFIFKKHVAKETI